MAANAVAANAVAANAAAALAGAGIVRRWASALGGEQSEDGGRASDVREPWTKEQLRTTLRSLLQSSALVDADLLNACDRDGNGQISRKELLRCMKRVFVAKPGEGRRSVEAGRAVEQWDLVRSSGSHTRVRVRVPPAALQPSARPLSEGLALADGLASDPLVPLRRRRSEH